jgi:carboxylesterase type B
MTRTDRQLAAAITDYWVSFARTGNPNHPDLPSWPGYEKTTEPCMDFGDVLKIRNHVLTPQLDFLEKVPDTPPAPL